MNTTTEATYEEPGQVPLDGPQYGERYQVIYRSSDRIGWKQTGQEGRPKVYIQEIPLYYITDYYNREQPKEGEL